MAKNENGKRLITWIKTKGIALAAMFGLVAVIYMIRWLVVIPYYTHSYLNVGHWGIIIGGFLMFIVANLPLGIISVVIKLDEGDLQVAESIMGLISAVIVGVTYIQVYADI